MPFFSTMPPGLGQRTGRPLSPTGKLHQMSQVCLHIFLRRHRSEVELVEYYLHDRKLDGQWKMEGHEPDIQKSCTISSDSRMSPEILVQMIQDQKAKGQCLVANVLGLHEWLRLQ